MTIPIDRGNLRDFLIAVVIGASVWAMMQLF
jgi:hypothetical protein